MDGAAQPRGAAYERTFTFSAQDADSSVLVPLFFHVEASPDGIRREIRGWIARGGSWEDLVSEEWMGGPGPGARRILPRGGLRLVVGQGDAIETIAYRGPPGGLDLDLGATLADWSDPRGGTFRLEESSLAVGDRTYDGITLDMTRTWEESDSPGGDWAYLVSGDSLQVVLESPGIPEGREVPEPDAAGTFRAYVRIDLRALQWPEVTVAWTETRAFEAARRDVPQAWRIASDDGALSGILESGSAELSAGTAAGPVLPVEALFEVRGTFSVEGRDFPVHGLYRHERDE